MANATTYYVDQAHGSASDSNACTALSAPCLTIDGGIGKMSSGDTLYVRTGSYDFPTSLPPSGSAGNQTTVARYQSESVTMTATGDQPLFFDNQSYITFDGFNMVGAGPSTTDKIVFFWDGSSHNRIVNNSFSLARTAVVDGFSQPSGGYNEIVDNTMRTGNYNPADLLAPAIYLESGNNLIEGNDISQTKGYCIQIYTGTAELRTDNTIVRSNWCHDSTSDGVKFGGAGFNIASGDNLQVYNNIITNNQSLSTGGDGVIWISDATNVKIYNNTIYGNESLGTRINSGVTGNFKNNIMWQNCQATVSCDWSNTEIINEGSVTVGNNLCDEIITGCSVTGDPLFVNAAGDDFHLSAGSDAIDGGTDLSSVFTTDYEGTTRTGTWEIGAYNFTSTPIEALVLSLDFNEGSGLPQDSSGYGNHVTALGSGNSWSAGHTGNGVTFGGTAYATIADSNSLDLSTAFTLEVWVKPTTTPSTYTALLVKDYIYYLYSANNGTFCSGNGPIGGYNVSGDVVACRTAGLTQDTWSHIAVTYDSTLGSANIKLYINGSEVDTTDATATLTATSGIFSIGGSSFGEYFAGIIDDVKVYNYARTAEEICTDGCGVAARQVGPIFLFY